MTPPGRQVGDDLPRPEGDRAGYWDAAPFVETVLAEFRRAVERRRTADAEHRYEVIASYCRRTLGIVRSALDEGDEPLAVAALENFLRLHDATIEMRRLAPRLVPDTAVMNRHDRSLLLEDHIVDVFDRAARPLTVEELGRRLVDGGRTLDGEVRLLEPHLARLVESGHLRRDPAGRLARTGRRHQGVERGSAALESLIGVQLRRALHDGGIRSVFDIVIDPAHFTAVLGDVFAQRATLDAFVRVARRLADESAVATRGAWPPPGLRAYQRDAFDALRAGHYAGLVVDAPAGSGKTLIGSMCVVDWLEHLAPGQSVLIAVPTVNLQRQWVRELCFSVIGPKLASHLVTTGTVGSLLAGSARARLMPAVTVVTYSALADAAASAGGFSKGRVERLLQALHVQYVLLDEVHTAAEDLDSLTAQVVTLFSEWRTSGMLRGVVGLSATAVPFADRLPVLGLTIGFEVGELELVANGYIAPFAEAGVAFGYSQRERELRTLVRTYRDATRAWCRVLGEQRLRSWFAALPMDERVAIGHRLLRLTSRRPDHDAGLAERFAGWESGGSLRVGEWPLIAIVQAATGASDHGLAARAATEAGDPSIEARARVVTRTMGRLRGDAVTLSSHDRNRRRLRSRGFATSLDSGRLDELMADETLAPTERWADARDVLASTVVGTFLCLRDEAQHVGQGRVDTIAAIVDAERSARSVSGIVVFERGGALRIDDGVATPGHRGLAGTFASFLGRDHLTPMAVLANELYLPARSPSIARAIAAYVRLDVVANDLVRLLVELVTAGLDIEADHRVALEQLAGDAVGETLASLEAGHALRAADVDATVLRPMRRMVRAWPVGPLMTRVDRAAMADRLSRRDHHLRSWMSSFSDHVRLAGVFDRAHAIGVRSVDGARHQVEIVHLPPGSGRQLAYELVARLVDRSAGSTSDVPVVDILVVSSWARAGWNVVRPNVLIDATATRDRVAWQQLRGRALRPWASWSPERQHDLAILRAHDGDALEEAVELLVAHNKVAHVYELLKGYGTEPQVRPDASGRLRRIPPLAAKHRREFAVDLQTGRHGTGERHAGLVVAIDPRVDTPAELTAALARVLDGADRRVVHGWLHAAATTSTQTRTPRSGEFSPHPGAG